MATTESTSEDTRAFVRLEHAQIRSRTITLIDWALGNTCNQACSYCPASLHDGSSPFPPIEHAVSFCAAAIKHYGALGRETFFHFSGGEPTLYRELPTLIQFLKSRGSSAGVVSNGSRSISWWRKFSPNLDAVVLTYHVEFARLEHFQELLSVLTESLKTHVNLTMVPDRFDECLAIARKLTSQNGGITLTLKPLLLGFGNEMYPYTKEQKLVMQSFTARSTSGRQGARGMMQCVYDSGEISKHHAAHFVLTERNRWRGWMCNAGIEQLAVNIRGDVYRATCQQGGLLGRIGRGSIQFPSGPVECEKSICSCLSDIMTTRWRIGSAETS